MLVCRCQIDQLLSAREDINASLAGKGKLSVNDFIVKAAALSCKKVPAINASWMGDFVRQYHNVDVNVAVASPAGLMVPFVRDADKKGLMAISEEVKGLAAKVGGSYCIHIGCSAGALTVTAAAAGASASAWVCAQGGALCWWQGLTVANNTADRPHT